MYFTDLKNALFPVLHGKVAYTKPAENVGGIKNLHPNHNTLNIKVKARLLITKWWSCDGEARV